MSGEVVELHPRPAAVPGMLWCCEVIRYADDGNAHPVMRSWTVPGDTDILAQMLLEVCHGGAAGDRLAMSVTAVQTIKGEQA